MSCTALVAQCLPWSTRPSDRAAAAPREHLPSKDSASPKPRLCHIRRCRSVSNSVQPISSAASTRLRALARSALQTATFPTPWQRPRGSLSASAVCALLPKGRPMRMTLPTAGVLVRGDQQTSLDRWCRRGGGGGGGGGGGVPAVPAPSGRQSLRCRRQTYTHQVP